MEYWNSLDCIYTVKIMLPFKEIPKIPKTKSNTQAPNTKRIYHVLTGPLQLYLLPNS